MHMPIQDIFQATEGQGKLIIRHKNETTVNREVQTPRPAKKVATQWITPDRPVKKRITSSSFITTFMVGKTSVPTTPIRNEGKKILRPGTAH
jgi:hypothetical protein